MGTDGQTYRETEFALHRLLSEPITKIKLQQLFQNLKLNLDLLLTKLVSGRVLEEAQKRKDKHGNKLFL